MIAPADRMSTTQTYYFATKLQEIEKMNQKGEKVINLGIGSPDLPPHPNVIKRLTDAAHDASNHGYQSYKGTPALRSSFAQWYKKYYNVSLNPDKEILPLIGSKEGIAHISMTFLNENDAVLVPNPGYPAYAAASRLAGARIIYYDLDESNDWQPDLEALSKTDLDNVKLMWVNYPNMPTGAKGNETFFKSLIAFAKANNILLCNDNPYSFILNDNPTSILSIPGAMEVTLELNSLSKSHNMAGWRMGMVAGNATYLNHILRYKSNIDSGMFLPIQHAAVEALQCDTEWYQQQNKVYEARRNYAWQIMDMLGCTYDKTQCGMFVWGKSPSHISDVEKWVDSILYDARVFITPGFIFGSNGSRYIRLSLCSNEDMLKNALEKIKRTIK